MQEESGQNDGISLVVVLLSISGALMEERHVPFFAWCAS
jgi:hypothetical protein